jgi:putative transcription antitermination factor YqgF
MYLSIDLWDKRCWIAIEQAGIVFPKEIVLRPKLLQTLKKYISEYKITIIVVWLPYDLYWKNHKQLQKTQEYIKYLQSQFPSINIEWCDERFTSFAADEISLEMWDNSKRDDIAAALILETYLEQKK